MVPNQGAVALTKAIGGDRRLRTMLALKCDVSVQSIRNWETGACVPKAKYRPTIKREVGVEGALFDRPLVKKAA
jgi:hypothetical protein